MSELQVLQNKAARLILDLPAQFSSAEAGSHYCDVERNIMLFLCLNILTTISVTLSLSHSMVIFIVTTQDREMTFANLVPQEHGAIGRQQILALDTLLRNAESLPAFKHGLALQSYL